MSIPDRVDYFVIGAGSAGVEGPLLGLRRLADAALGAGVADDGEEPWLVVGAAGRRAGRADAVGDDLAGHWPRGELPQRAAARHLRVELGRAAAHLGRAVLPEVAVRHSVVLAHGSPRTWAPSVAHRRRRR